jgi:flagella basal body P-ring formation protein FlgA
MRCLLLAVGLLLPFAGDALADTTGTLEAIRAAASRYLAAQTTQAYPGTTSTIEIGPIDSGLDLAGCETQDISLMPGSRLWANGNLLVQCEGGSRLSFYLAFRASLEGPALLARRPLPSNYTPTADDLVEGRIEYRSDPRRYPVDPAKLHGARLSMPMAKHAPLIIDMLRTPTLIRAGQRVRILSDGPGFQVTQSGIAQQQAGPGDLLRVKLSNGHYVQGLVKDDGSVYIKP